MQEIEGIVEDIIFYNEVNGYIVCELKYVDKLVTVVGNMPFVSQGETLKVIGTWVTHPDYGEQFKASTYQKIMPGTSDAIERYLASGIIKGIRAATAKKIVDRFGDQTLKILEFESEKLALLKGISKKKAIEIGQAFAEQKRLMSIIMFFQEYGVGPSYAMKAYKTFGETVIEEVKKNPYRLSDEIYGIGFKTADKIAQSMGTDKYSKYRICSGIKYVLTQAAVDGQTFLPEQRLKEQAAMILDININEVDINDALVTLSIEKVIHIEKSYDFNKIYLKPFYIAEMNVCQRLINLMDISFEDFLFDFEKKINNIQKEEGVELSISQKEAVKEVFSNGVCVITGGPGTGKTTIIKTIIKIFTSENKSVILTAPTGRAAKRMSEATGYEAKTIHRLLEVDFMKEGQEQSFLKDEANPIDADVVIVDEMSMVDILLMNNLLKAIPAGTRLVMVGDVDQLPSVGAGNVLKDIISSEIVKTVKLTEIFRQAKESMIVINAHKINKGEEPLLNVKNKDFFFMPRNTGEDIVKTIVELCSVRLPRTYDYDPMLDIQVLTSTKKGVAGVINLNCELQKELNPNHKYKREKAVKSFILREGDRVMQIRNNYNIKWIGEDGEGVFNGDTGIISKIDEEKQEVMVNFEDGKIICYDFNNLDELEHAFSLTIHKSQGSEFKAVVIPLFRGPKVLQTRNLLYTAITRAKEMVIVVGLKSVMSEMIDNNSEILRYSSLGDKLKKIVAGISF